MITQVDVGSEVFLQQQSLIGGVAVLVLTHHLLETCISQVLVADILALDGSLETSILEGEDVVEDEVRREAQWSLAQASFGLAIFEGYHHVFSTIL